MDFRTKILGCQDHSRVEVATPEWAHAGVKSLFVKTMSGVERETWEQMFVGANGKVDKAAPLSRGESVRASLVCWTAVDHDGKRIFELADAQTLAQKNAAVIGRLFEAAIKLNKLSEEDLKELEGNSTASPT